MSINKITIHANGQDVDCYGEFCWDSNVCCVFEDESFDGIYADGAETWEQAVETLTLYAKNNGTELIEATAV